jgi:hypothetical protein
MSTRLQQRDWERIETLAQISVLDVVRHLLRSGADQLEQAATWALIEEEAGRHAQECGARARTEGASFSEVARAVRMTPQGARKRYGHLEVV